MSDVWDIASYVEEHPEDYPQRWRLAKRLYVEHEYRLALEHLNVLKNDWTPKLNVRRYLGATYYRLGRYVEATREIEESISIWPDEIGPREQLAHILKATGNLEGSLAAWEQVLRMNPNHSLARHTAEKIRIALAFKNGPGKSELPEDAASDAELIQDREMPVPGLVCFNCGAHNSDEFESCWRCGQKLQQPDKSFFNTPSVEAHGPLLLRPETITSVSMIAMLLLLAGAAFLAVTQISDYRSSFHLPLDSLSDLYNRILVPSRLAAGIVMLVLWPFSLTLMLRLLRITPLPPVLLLYTAGWFLGAVTTLLLLMPLTMLIPAAAIPLFISLMVIIAGFRLQTGRAVALWMSHFLIVWVAGLTVFWATECFMYKKVINPMAEIAAVQSFAQTPRYMHESGPIRIPNAITPLHAKIQWESTGSEWLDSRLASTGFIYRSETAAPGLFFQIYDGKDLRFHEELNMRQNLVFSYSIQPGKTYEVAVTGADNVIVQILVQSLLNFKFIE